MRQLWPARQRAKVARHSGSAKPKVRSNLAVQSTVYAGRRAAVGYSAVVIGTTRGRCALPMIAVAKSHQVALPAALR